MTPMREITITHPDGTVEVIREADAEMAAAYISLLQDVLDRIEHMQREPEETQAEFERRMEEEAARAQRYRQIIEALEDIGIVVEFPQEE